MLSLFISPEDNFKTCYKAPQKATQDGGQSSTPVPDSVATYLWWLLLPRFPSPGITYLNNLPELKPFPRGLVWENSGQDPNLYPSHQPSEKSQSDQIRRKDPKPEKRRKLLSEKTTSLFQYLILPQIELRCVLSHSVVSRSLQPHGLQPSMLL